MRTTHFAGAKVTVDIESKAYKNRWGHIEDRCTVSINSVESVERVPDQTSLG